MGFELSKKKIITIAAIVIIVAAALYVVYDLNGKSFDMQNRETRIVVTNSMDGDVHPDGYWHCNNGACGSDWIAKHSKTSATCPHCGYNNSEYVSKSFDIEKIPVNSLIMIKKLDDTQKQDIQVGDVIAFNWNNRLTVHRVIDVETNSANEITGFTTKGDNASGKESPSLAAVSGVVVGESGWLGSVVHFAQGSTILFVMMIVILIVIVSVVRDIFRIRNRS